MPAPNLKNMDVDALLDLRSQIDGQLATRRSELDRPVPVILEADGEVKQKDCCAQACDHSGKKPRVSHHTLAELCCARNEKEDR